MSRRTRTLARRFELVLEVLEDQGYVEGWELTEAGEALRRIYNEADLLVVEAVRAGLLDDLDGPEIAALLSCVVYEARGPEPERVGRMPTPSSRRAWEGLVRLWSAIRGLEEARGLDLTREPDPGFAERAHLWASGAELDEVLDADDAPGDFVRNMKQLIDLLRQLEDIAPADDLRETIQESLRQVKRGVVAYSSVEL
jgi:ATP-dependent RNA helicase HelY